MLLASKKNNNRIPTRLENVSSARRRSLIPIRSVSFRSINKMRLLDLLSLSCLHLLWSIWNLIVVSLFLLAACRTPQSVGRRVYFRVVRFEIFGCSCRSWFKFWLCRTKNTRRENSFIRQRNKRKNLKKTQKIEKKICVDVCLAMGAKRFMRLPSGKCHRRLRQTHTHTRA